jgi:ABC-type Na+ efflux pump permease subunit
MAIGVLGAIYPLKSTVWMYGIPLLSQYTLVTNVIGGTTPGILSHVLATVVSLGLSALLVAWTTRLFKNERIIFGR